MKFLPWRRTEAPQQLGRFRGEMDRLFDRFFEDVWPAEAGWMPDVEVRETEKEITVMAELPGMEAKDVELQLDGDLLTISGEKKEEQEEKGRELHRREIRYGMFRREVPLPSGADPSKVTATFDKGVLRVSIAKDEATQPRRIPVQGGAKEQKKEQG